MLDDDLINSLQDQITSRCAPSAAILLPSFCHPSSWVVQYLVFGGGGARCFGYAGALHALRQLGLLGGLKGVSGSSGGAVYALLAALNFRWVTGQEACGIVLPREPCWQGGVSLSDLHCLETAYEPQTGDGSAMYAEGGGPA
jgi:hypothetical protein